MQNYRIHCLAIVFLILAGGTSFLNAEGELKDGYPSKAYFEKTAKGQASEFLLLERPDLRLLFCDRPVLKDRIHRSVCVVGGARTKLVKNGWSRAREIQISASVSAGELLKQIGLEKWNGGQPQLRIVKRDAIIQSPLESDTAAARPDISAFLSQKLEPGDFLIITFIS